MGVSVRPHINRLPPTLDEYLRTVVAATLERQRQAGCVAVKFEVAYLRGLDFDDASPAAAAVYGRFAGVLRILLAHAWRAVGRPALVNPAA